LNVSKGSESSQSETVSPEWQRIAPAALIPSQEIARLFIQAVIFMAVSKAKAGHQVTLGFKLGKLTISQGHIDF
jgi:hypothetical protein